MKDLLTLILGFAPWILFLFLSGHTLHSLEFSIIISLIATVVFGFRELRKGFLLQWGTLLFFTACFVLINILHVYFIAEYMGILANGFLALIIWITIIAGKPFTLQYARENLPAFKHNDQKLIDRCQFLALIWGCLLTFATLIACFRAFNPGQLPYYVYFDISITIILGGILFTHYYKKQNSKQDVEIEFHTGTKEDSKEIASLIISAGGGIVEFLLHDLSKQFTITQLMQKQVEDEQSEFYYGNCIVASMNGKVVGLALAYPASLVHKPEADILPESRVTHLKEFYQKKIQDSLYLHALAVSPEARKRGIAHTLLGLVTKKAQSKNLNSISLDVWCDNQGAISLYEKLGYHVVDTIHITTHKLLPHDNGMQVMRKGVKGF